MNQKIIALGNTHLRLDDVVAVYIDDDDLVTVELRHGGPERVYQEEYATLSAAKVALMEFVQQWKLVTRVAQLGDIVLAVDDVVAVYIDDDDLVTVELRHGGPERAFQRAYETLDDAEKAMAIFVGQWQHLTQWAPGAPL